MGKKTIPADPAMKFKQAITITIGDEIGNYYEPVPKPFPADLSTSCKDESGKNRTITWISNFEIKRKDGVSIPSTDKRLFSVTIPQATGEVVYCVGGQIHSFDPPAIGTGGPITITLPLGIGDPPVGLAH